MSLESFLDALERKPAAVRSDFVGYLVFELAQETNVEDLPPDMAAMLDIFIERAGFTEDDDVDETRRKIDAHFAKHPPDPELLALFGVFTDETGQAMEAAGAERARQAQQVMASSTSSVPVGAGGRQAGTLAGGPLGMVMAKAPPKRSPPR